MAIVSLVAEFFEGLKSFNFDSNLFKFFRNGLVIGICITTGLAFFPGTPATEEVHSKDSESRRQPKVEERKATSSGESQEQEAQEQEAQQQPQEPSNPQQKHGRPGSLSEEERRLYRRILDQRRGQGAGSWTPHQQMNFVVYIILIGVAFVVISHSYDDKRGFLKHWLAHHFPREASVLGYKPRIKG